LKKIKYVIIPIVIRLNAKNSNGVVIMSDRAIYGNAEVFAKLSQIYNIEKLRMGNCQITRKAVQPETPQQAAERIYPFKLNYPVEAYTQNNIASTQRAVYIKGREDERQAQNGKIFTREDMINFANYVGEEHAYIWWENNQKPLPPKP
jgi:hypothetical protein